MVCYGIFWSGQLPIRHFGNERGTGTEMRPTIVSGIVTGDASLAKFFFTSLVTVPDVFAKVNSFQFTSHF